jgi:transglutaminase-like putative cysteine protease
LVLVCVAFVTPVHGQEPAGKVIVDRWESAYLKDKDGTSVRSGHVHTQVVERSDSGQPGYQATIAMKLQVSRFGNKSVTLGMEVGDKESAKGFVTGTMMRQFDGAVPRVVIEGTVIGNKLQLTLNKMKPLDPAPWRSDVVGVYGQQMLLKEKAAKPGDEVDFWSFEPSINLIIKQHARVIGLENVKLLGETRKLLRVDIEANKIQGFQPPPLTVWLDGAREVVASETMIPGIGQLNLYRSTKDIATAATGVAHLAEVNQFIPIRQRVPNFNATKSALLRIRIAGDDDAGTSFALDGRQKRVGGAKDTLELEIKEGPVDRAEQVGPEYLESSHYITSADPKVKEMAQLAVRGETDPWRKALLVEKYVKSRMQPAADQALATAQETARLLRGDCTEYAMLTAAMCRAEGVPARTAIGLVYGEIQGRPPFFAFHMWTEVFAGREWRALDATLGQGHVGAMHVKISSQSWHNEATAAPLLPTLRVLGKASIDVLRVEPASRP